MKPNLVDYSQFIKKPLKKNIIKTEIIETQQDNTIFYLINIIFILIIFIGLYLLYLRYKQKDKNNLIYKKKIENLYNTINKY